MGSLIIALVMYSSCAVQYAVPVVLGSFWGESLGMPVCIFARPLLRGSIARFATCISGDKDLLATELLAVDCTC
jgi:hypothetical protein